MSGTITDSSLRVERFNATYFIARDHPAPDRLKGKLDDVAQKDLTNALSAAMLRYVSATDESVWLIRRLNVNVDVNAGWDRDILANSWANQIQRSLKINLRSDTDSQNVIHFPNRAAYLAAFLNDLANSNAWGKWYYQSFDGLQLLPLSASLRTAICDNAEKGLRALLQLDNHQLNAVLRALSARDAQRVLKRLTEVGHEATNETSCLRVLLPAFRETQADHLEEPNDILRLCLTVCRKQIELMSPTLGNVATSLVRLRSLLGTTDSNGRKKLIAAISSQDIATLYSHVGSSDAEVLWLLTRCPAGEVHDAALVLLGRQTEVAEAPASGPRYTQFGGVFLLLRVLDEMPIDEATEGWPTSDQTTAAAIVRFLVLMHCYGGTRASMFFADLLLRDLVSIPPTLSVEKLTDWQNELAAQQLRGFKQTLDRWSRSTTKRQIAKNTRYLTLGGAFRFSQPFARAMRAAAQHLMGNFARKLPGFSESGLEYLHRNFLDFPATMEDEPARRVITLGRPPLNLVLNLSGLNRGSFQLNFLDERPFALFDQG